MAEHLIGKKIILKSNSEIRYTGTLHAIDTAGKSISLIDVLSLGTEDRVTPGGYVAPANTVYPYVVFRAADVTDIAVIDEPVTATPPTLPHDDAILAQGAPPTAQQQTRASPRQAAPPIVPPIAPSIATAHSNTLERVQHDFQAVPTRQPAGPPSVIPFEQLAAAGPSRGFSRGRGPSHPAGGARRGRGRAPGAFSYAAEQEDVTQEFDFASMNQRFEDLRIGEKPEGHVEAPVEAENVPVKEEEKPKPAAYNKSSSFFDSVSSNIQTPGRGRGRPPNFGGGGGGRPRDPTNYPSNLPPRPPVHLPPHQSQPNNHHGRWNRRDESALNDLTFGEGSGDAASSRRGRGRGHGRRGRGNEPQPQ